MMQNPASGKNFSRVKYFSSEKLTSLKSCLLFFSHYVMNVISIIGYNMVQYMKFEMKFNEVK